MLDIRLRLAAQALPVSLLVIVAMGVGLPGIVLGELSFGKFLNAIRVEGSHYDRQAQRDNAVQVSTVDSPEMLAEIRSAQRN